MRKILKQDFCDCCGRGDVKLKKVYLHNCIISENMQSFCDCDTVICNACVHNEKVFEEYLELKSEKCSCNCGYACGCLEFNNIKKENKR